MRYPDHLHHCLRRCQDTDSSDERGRSRVPRETVRSSIVAQSGSICTWFVSKQVYSNRMRCLEGGILWQIMQQLRTLRWTRPNADSNGSSGIALPSNLFSSRWRRWRPQTRLSSSTGKPAQEKNSLLTPFTTPVSGSDARL